MVPASKTGERVIPFLGFKSLSLRQKKVLKERLFLFIKINIKVKGI